MATYQDTGAGKPNSATVLGTMDDGVTAWERSGEAAYDGSVGRTNERIYFSVASKLAQRVVPVDSTHHLIGADFVIPNFGEFPGLVVRYYDQDSYIVGFFGRDTWGLAEVVDGVVYSNGNVVVTNEDRVYGTWPDKTSRRVYLFAYGNEVMLYDDVGLVGKMTCLNLQGMKTGFGLFSTLGNGTAVRVDNVAISTY